MSKEGQKIIDYIAICVNEFVDRFSANYKESFK